MSSIISLQPQIRNNHSNLPTHSLDQVSRNNQPGKLFNNSSLVNNIKNNVKKIVYQEYQKKDPHKHKKYDAYDLVIAEITRQSKLRKQNNTVSTQLKKTLYQTFHTAKINTQNNNHKVFTPLEGGEGGKHKGVYFNKVLWLGYVVGKSKTASKDAEREQAIEKYTNSLNNPKLSCMISTQKPITQKDIDKDPALKLMLSKSGINPKTVAKFELKNKHGISYEGFHDYIKKVRENKKLSVEQKAKIAKSLMHNFISTLYYLGVNKISNADLHGKNLKISFKSDDIFNPSQIEHLEVFDWGKSTEGDNFKFNETLDFTLKEGDFLKKVQQKYMSSDELRSRRMVFADIMSLVTGNAASGYKEFKSGNFAKQANEVYNKLNQINKKYSNREHSPALMQKYQNAYLKALTIFASFADDRIDQLILIANSRIDLPKQCVEGKRKDVYTTKVTRKTNGIFSRIFMGLTQIKNSIIWQSLF